MVQEERRNHEDAKGTKGHEEEVVKGEMGNVKNMEVNHEDAKGTKEHDEKIVKGETGKVKNWEGNANLKILSEA